MCALQKFNENLLKYVTICMSLYVCTQQLDENLVEYVTICTWINMLKFVCHCMCTLQKFNKNLVKYVKVCMSLYVCTSKI